MHLKFYRNTRRYNFYDNSRMKYLTLLKKENERKKKKEGENDRNNKLSRIKEKKKKKYCTIKLAITMSVLKLKIIRCMRYDV